MKTKFYPIARIFLLALLFLGFQSVTFSQQTAKNLTAANGQYIGFYEFRPYDYNANNNLHPLIIFMHGTGERGNGTTDLSRVLANAIPKYCANGATMEFTVAGVKHSFVVLSPQLNSQYGVWQNFYVEEMIKYAKANLKVDPNRIYLCGLSLGGGGVWKYPTESAAKAQQIAAIAPVCGTGEGTNFCNIAQNRVGVWSLHAMDDYTVGVGNTFYAINQINACNPIIVPKQTIYEFGGHAIWDRAFDMGHSIQNPNVYEWLLTHDRSQAPPVNQAPIAKAGPDKLVVLPAVLTTLDGSGSSDPDGAVTSYQWTKVAGPGAFVIVSPNSATTVVSGLGIGTYTFRLTVTDNQGSVSTDDVDINVYPAGAGYNMPPVAAAGPDATITSNNFILNAYGTGDPDGTLTSISWTKVSGPSQYLLQDSIYTVARLSNLVSGTYVFRISVVDNGGLTASDEMQLTVNLPGNQSPIANAGPNQSVTTTTASLNGSSSYDPNGSITAWSWTKTAGPASYTISNASIASPNLSNLTSGTYTFRLQVTDNQGASATDDVDIVVNLPAANQPPVARAGADQTVTTTTASLNGSTSSDPDGSIASYAWSKISGPASFTFSSTSIASPTLSNLVSGSYTFRLTVTDNGGLTSTDDVVINVNLPVPNQSPVARAGADQNITVSNTSLDGSASSDPDGSITSYAWSKIAGPASFTFSSTSIASPSLTNLTNGTYSFRLQVTDNQGGTSADTVLVTVNIPVPNQAPVAVAGADQSITTNSASLNGSSSYDPDGTIASYSWTKISGPASFAISNGAIAAPTASSLVSGTYRFRLVVTDNQGATDADTVTINVAIPSVNIPPVAVAGDDVTINTGTVVLNAWGTNDPDGTVVSYLWSKISGPASYSFNNTSYTTPTVSSLVNGVYQFRLVATDNQGATGADTVSVTVDIPAPNVVPIANAGADINITLPTNSVTLNGGGSSDPDGTISSYSWTKIAGPAGFSIATPSGVSTSVTALVEGVYRFRLVVTDNSGATAADTVSVSVAALPPPPGNVVPVANAGGDVTITLPVNSVQLNGSGTDADGTITNYSWTKIAGPAQYTIVSASQASTDINNLVQGVYSFRLAVTDNGGATSADTVQVYVNAAPPPPPVNQVPVANAGSDITITLPVNSTTLNGTLSSDPDGNIVSYAWNKISGPVQYTIDESWEATTGLSNLVQGVYRFRLDVTDNDGGTDADTVTVTVNAALPPPPPPNVAPVARAGADITITLPVNNTTLDGSASTDANGTITGYSWTRISGPAQFSIADASAVITNLNNLVQGQYAFRLQVTDNDGATAADTVLITVNAAVPPPPPPPPPPPVNQVPVANAGNDVNITLPVNSTQLDGAASSDPDGSIVSYAWTKTAGPAQFTISNPAVANPQLTNLVEGVYTFTLVVTDNSGATAQDVVQITVVPRPIIVPFANAGADQSIVLPLTTVYLDGTASHDPDGFIVDYTWTKISGPGATTIVNSNSATPTVIGLVEGVYVFELTVTDNVGVKATDRVTVTVSSIPNEAPIANAGKDTTVLLPATTAWLNASASRDPDGTISSYKWRQLAGPVNVQLGAGNVSAFELKNLQVGDYVFEVTVTDNLGASSKAVVKISVVNNFRYSQFFKVFPNPAHSILNLQYIDDKTGKFRVTIYDAAGKLSQHHEFNKDQTLLTREINVSALKPGVYYLEIQQADGLKLLRPFVKQ